jgi:flavin reductase (DIM6/NTAB) family NADH-FMN oxidoreductase RutF
MVGPVVPVERVRVDPFEYLDDVNHLLRHGGLLLVTQGAEGPPNAMTIGWGLLGTMWRRPVFVVAVRTSRHTYRLLEEANRFTVGLPTRAMGPVLALCGNASGRDVDKLRDLGLSVGRGVEVDAPYLEACPVHYECTVVYKDPLKPGALPAPIEGEVYPSGNRHVLYYGAVKGAFARADAPSALYEQGA